MSAQEKEKGRAGQLAFHCSSSAVSRSRLLVLGNLTTQRPKLPEACRVRNCLSQRQPGQVSSSQGRGKGGTGETAMFIVHKMVIREWKEGSKGYTIACSEKKRIQGMVDEAVDSPILSESVCPCSGFSVQVDRPALNCERLVAGSWW